MVAVLGKNVKLAEKQGVRNTQVRVSVGVSPTSSLQAIQGLALHARTFVVALIASTADSFDLMGPKVTSPGLSLVLALDSASDTSNSFAPLRQYWHEPSVIVFKSERDVHNDIAH